MQAEPLLRPFIGVREYLHGEKRLVFWLVGASTEQIKASPRRRGRVVEGPVRDARGNWRCSLVHALRERELTVAVALGWDAEFSRQVVVVTVFGDR